MCYSSWEKIDKDRENKPRAVTLALVGRGFGSHHHSVTSILLPAKSRKSLVQREVVPDASYEVFYID